MPERIGSPDCEQGRHDLCGQCSCQCHPRAGRDSRHDQPQTGMAGAMFYTASLDGS